MAVPVRFHSEVDKFLEFVEQPQNTRLPEGIKTAFPLKYDPKHARSFEFLLGDCWDNNPSRPVHSTNAPGQVPLLVPQGVQGSGKTKSIANMALRDNNPAWVFYTNCAAIKHSLEATLKQCATYFRAKNPAIDSADVTDVESDAYQAAKERAKQLDDLLQLVFLRRVIAYMYVLLALMKRFEKLSHRIWLHFCFTVGGPVVASVADDMKHLTSADLYSLANTLRLQLPDGDVVAAWDEAQVLFSVLPGQVMRRDSKDADGAPTNRFTREGSLDKTRASSAFALVCRAGLSLGDKGITTCVAGTAFRIEAAALEATAFMKDMITLIRPPHLDAASVRLFVKHYLDLSQLSADVTEGIFQRLAGRFRPVVYFVEEVHKLLEKPSFPLPSSFSSSKKKTSMPFPPDSTSITSTGGGLTDAIFLQAFAFTFDRTVQYFAESWSAKADDTVSLSEGIRWSRRETISNLIADRTAVLTHTQAEVISRTFLDLVRESKNDNLKSRYRLNSKEPFALRALAHVMYSHEPEFCGAKEVQRALQSTVEGKTQDHGPLGELALELVLLRIGRINQKLRGQGKQPKALTEFKLFQHLDQGIWSQYAIVACKASYESDGWKDVLGLDGSVDPEVLLANVSTLLRPDIVLGLYPLRCGSPSGLLLAGCKLYNTNVSTNTFCSNFATTDVRRLFTTDAGTPLGSHGDRSHVHEFQTKFTGPVLGVAFLWGGVVGSVLLDQKAWAVNTTATLRLSSLLSSSLATTAAVAAATTNSFPTTTTATNTVAATRVSFPITTTAAAATSASSSTGAATATSASCTTPASPLVYHRMVITHASRGEFKELVEVPTLLNALDAVAGIDPAKPRKRRRSAAQLPENCINNFLENQRQLTKQMKKKPKRAL